MEAGVYSSVVVLEITNSSEHPDSTFAILYCKILSIIYQKLYFFLVASKSNLIFDTFMTV